MNAKAERLSVLYYSIAQQLEEASQLQRNLTQADIDSVDEGEYPTWLLQVAALVDSAQVFADPDSEAVDHLVQQRDIYV